MHENFGVFRREEQMLEQGRIIEGLRERYKRVVVDDKGEIFNNDLTQAIELGFMLDLAQSMVVAGLARKESRGPMPGRTTTRTATTRTSSSTR